MHTLGHTPLEMPECGTMTRNHFCLCAPGLMMALDPQFHHLCIHTHTHTQTHTHKCMCVCVCVCVCVCSIRLCIVQWHWTPVSTPVVSQSFRKAFSLGRECSVKWEGAVASVGGDDGRKRRMAEACAGREADAMRSDTDSKKK
jgi:hypothetical protein